MLYIPQKNSKNTIQRNLQKSDDVYTTSSSNKKEENFKLALMSRDEKIAYIVKQMEDIEANAPSMVEYCEPPTNDNFLQ